MREGAYGDAQGHLLLVPLRIAERAVLVTACQTLMWSVAEIGSCVAWIVLPPSSVNCVFE